MKILSVAILIMSARAAFGSCDCTIVPFPPACVKECMGKLAAKADYKDLTKGLGLSASTSEKIVTFSDRPNVKSIDAYEKVLNKQELATVKDKLSKADKRTVASILSPERTATNSKKKSSSLK
jgi:hypothetical protein